MPVPVEVTLSWDDIEEAAKKGVERNVNAHRSARDPRFIPRTDEEQWRGNIRGIIGEMVICRWFSWPFNPEVTKPDTHIGDVGKLQVRMWWKPELYVYKRDWDDHPICLVTGTLPLNGANPVYFVHGWRYVHEIRAIGVPKHDPGSGSFIGHYLHARDLHDPRSLYQQRDQLRTD